MPNIFTKIFANGAEKLVDSIGNAIDRNITSKDEREKNNIELQKIITEQIREMEKLANEQFAKEVEDRTSARNRETEFVKATGHIDYLMWALAIAGLGLLFFLVWHLVKTELPDKNKELIAHGVGIIEGVVISIYSYYFGSSAGSRIKDMKK